MNPPTEHGETLAMKTRIAVPDNKLIVADRGGSVYPLYARLDATAFLLCMVLLLVGWTCSHSSAAGPRVLPVGKQPQDHRLHKLKDLNGYFPFVVPATQESWKDRSQQLRRQVLVATGLWPMPDKTPLNPVMHGLTKRDGFTVEKVYFESIPQHFVVGLLFRPLDKNKRRPAILCPHGHGGRLQDHGPQKIREHIVRGAERFEQAGRFPKISRCVQLARMGCVTFIYDMLGYADSQQLSGKLVHKFAKQRPAFDDQKSWGFFSTQAELRLQSVLGLQTWNSLRALDFLCSLPDVDPQRVGVTGGSGGGTQTLLLCAIDPRPSVSFPQGMVSTAMQGGCTCENCSLLRVGTGNVELTALFAPKPVAMTAADDWTKEMMTKGYPELQTLYKLLGTPEKVHCWPLTHFPHNYNYVTRALMYHWFNRHLELELEEPIVEEDYLPLTPEEQTIWNKEHPAPSGGDEHERTVTQWLADTANRQLARFAPQDTASLTRFREIIGGAFETIIGRTLPSVGPIERTKVNKIDRGQYLEFTDILRVTQHEEELPVISLYPKSCPWNGEVIIWIDGSGKDSLYASPQTLVHHAHHALSRGYAILTADLLYQGEFLAVGETANRNRVVNNPREFAGYTYCYNPSLFAHRVHDILTLIAFARNETEQPQRIHLLGIQGAGPWVAAAKTQAGSAIDKVAIDTGGFRFVQLQSYRDINFLPGSVKYGDLPALLALDAPDPLWIAGESGQTPGLVTQAYQAAGQPQNIISVQTENIAVDAVEWLTTAETK